MPTVGRSGSCGSTSTWTTSPIVDRHARLLERLARRRLADVFAPLDVAARQAPQAGAEVAGPRCTMSTWPAAFRITTAAPTPMLAKKTKPHAGHAGRGIRRARGARARRRSAGSTPVVGGQGHVARMAEVRAAVGVEDVPGQETRRRRSRGRAAIGRDVRPPGRRGAPIGRSAIDAREALGVALA